MKGDTFTEQVSDDIAIVVNRGRVYLATETWNKETPERTMVENVEDLIDALRMADGFAHPDDWQPVTDPPARKP